MRLNSKLTKRLDTLIETIPTKKLALGYLQYEIMAKMTPKEFTVLYNEQLKGTKLDEQVLKIGLTQ